MRGTGGPRVLLYVRTGGRKNFRAPQEPGIFHICMRKTTGCPQSGRFLCHGRAFCDVRKGVVGLGVFTCAGW